MEKKQFQDLISILKSIDMKLDILIAKQKSSLPAYKPTPSEEEILKLCNSKNTIKEIIEKTKKNRNQVDVTLSKLRNKGLIKSTTIKEKLVYKKI